jgi:hypothetical protein
MKYLLFTIVCYVALNTPTKAQDSGDKEDLEKQTILHGGVSIGTTVVKKEKVGLGQERILYAQTKYAEKQVALEIAIKEGAAVVVKAKEKISLAKASLEEEKRTNKISERVYIARKERLEMIEQKTKVLEGNINEN